MPKKWERSSTITRPQSVAACPSPLRKDPHLPCIVSTARLSDRLLSPLLPARIVQSESEDGALLTREAVLAALPDADAILNQGELRIDTALLGRAPKLRIVANIARGHDNLDLAAMTTHKVWATNVPTAFAVPTAEVALGLMLMVARRLAEADRYVRAGSWSRFDPGRWDGRTLAGKRLGLVGFGQIGRAVAERARAFDMEVIVCHRSPRSDDGYRAVPLAELLAWSDVVSLHVPATPHTFHLLSAGTIAQMRRGAILINTARGSVVDEAALVAALHDGHLGGAGLDVAEYEPRISPALLEMHNVVITPHLGGGTIESRQAAREWAIANVASVLHGQRPRSPLNTVEREMREDR